MGFFSSSSLKGEIKGKNTLPKCGSCGLSKNCYSPKMESHRGKLSVLFVGEFPGKNDDRTGKHVSGESGEILRDLVEDVGYALDDCHLTNSIICRPDKFDNKQPDYCKPNLLKTIKKLKPNIIFVMGAAPLTLLIEDDFKKSIDVYSRWPGWQIPSPSLNAWICPLPDPIFILQMKQDEALLKITRDYLKKGFAIKDTPEPLIVKELEKEIEIIRKPKLAYARLKDLYKKKGIVAFDYETTGLKPENPKQEIISCSFCFQGNDTFAFMWDERLKKVMKAILQKKELKKVASNLKFEERWSVNKLGTKVAGWHWDTMLAMHWLDNRRKITSIKFIAFVLMGVGNYDSSIEPYIDAGGSNLLNRMKELPVEDLLLYNGMDSLLEYKAMEKQKEMINWKGLK